MMKKILNIILFSLFLMIIAINSVYAAEVGIGVAVPASGSSSYEDDWVPTGPVQLPQLSYENPNNGKEYYCEYLYGIDEASTITVDGYDMEGNSLMEYTFAVEDTFKSGTWIGLRSAETKTADWYIAEFNCYEITYNYTCKYEYKNEYSGWDYYQDWENGTESCKTHTYRELQDGRFATKKSCNDRCGQSNEWDSKNRTCTCITSWDECTTIPKDVWIPTTHVDVTTKERKYYNQTKYFTCSATDSFDGKTYDYKEVSTETITKATGAVEPIRKQVANMAKADAQARVNNATADIKYITTNEYPTSEKVDSSSKYTGTLVARGEGIQNLLEEPYKGTYKQVFLYKPKYVCMNAKTAKVEYRDKPCDKNSGELDITTGKGKDGKDYWRYFVPLNTKTGSNFFIRVEQKAKTKLSEEQCNYIVEHYPIKSDYTYLIKKTNGAKFEGVVSKDKEDITKNNGCFEGKTRLSVQKCIEIINTNPLKNEYTNYIRPDENTFFVGDYIYGSTPSSIDKAKMEDGCIFSTAVNFNIEQNFYKEDNSKGYLSLKGYNMYFRQIDINNPFPNGIDTSTYWKGIYNPSNNSVKVDTVASKDKTIKFSDSYKTLTYKAEDVSRKKIKAQEGYDSPYTSWAGMNPDGSSKLITSGIIKRELKEYYKLGCGPANNNCEVYKQ